VATDGDFAVTARRDLGGLEADEDGHAAAPGGRRLVARGSGDHGSLRVDGRGEAGHASRKGGQDVRQVRVLAAMDVGDGVGDGLVGGFDRGVELCRGRNGVNVTCRGPDPDRVA